MHTHTMLNVYIFKACGSEVRDAKMGEDDGAKAKDEAAAKVRGGALGEVSRLTACYLTTSNIT